MREKIAKIGDFVVFSENDHYVCINKKTLEYECYDNLDQLVYTSYNLFGFFDRDLAPELHIAIEEYKQNKIKILKKNNITLWK